MKPVERVDRITALIDEVLDVGPQQEGDEHGADWRPWGGGARERLTWDGASWALDEVDGRGYAHGVYYPRVLSAEEIARVLAYYEQVRFTEITEA